MRQVEYIDSESYNGILEMTCQKWRSSIQKCIRAVVGAQSKC